MIKKLKKISLFLPLFFTSLLLASPTSSDGSSYVFYVESPDLVEIYTNIFTGIVNIFSSDSYKDLLRLVFLFGGFFTFAFGLFKSWGRGGQGALSDYAKYLAGGVALLVIIFSTKSTILVKTNNIPTYCNSSDQSAVVGATVSGIPSVLAYIFDTINEVGKFSTEIAEQAYGTPHMFENGGYAGALKQTLNVLSANIDRVTLNKMSNGGQPYDMGKVVRTIFSQCIFIPFSAKGQEGMDYLAKLKSSSNLYADIANLYENNVTIGGTPAGEFEATMNGEVWKCGNIYSTFFKDYASKYKDDVKCAIPVGKGAIQLLTNNVNPPANTFSEVALQAGLISSFNSTAKQLGVGVSGIDYASGKTRAEFIQTSLAAGEYMSKILPFLQMTIRAILYAFLPFVFVVTLLPGGLRVITQYLQTLLWVELWTPTAAILNMFLNSKAQTQLGETEYANVGLTAMNAVDMMSTASTISGIAGYLYMSVPALTWLILKGSGYMLGNLTAAMTGGLSRNITTESVNQDVAKVKETQQASLQTGEDLGITETQYYKAIQGGRVAGAVLGTQMNLGMDNVVENEAYKTSQEVNTFAKKREMLGGVSGETLGAIEGASNAIKTAPELLATAEFGLDSSGDISDGQMSAIQEDKKATIGAAKAKAEMQLDERTYTESDLTKRGRIVQSADVAQNAQKLFGGSMVSALTTKAKVEAASSMLNTASQDALLGITGVGREFNASAARGYASLKEGTGYNQLNESAARFSALSSQGISPSAAGTWSGLEQAFGFGQTASKKDYLNSNGLNMFTGGKTAVQQVTLPSEEGISTNSISQGNVLRRDVKSKGNFSNLGDMSIPYMVTNDPDTQRGIQAAINAATLTRTAVGFGRMVGSSVTQPFKKGVGNKVAGVLKIGGIAYGASKVYEHLNGIRKYMSDIQQGKPVKAPEEHMNFFKGVGKMLSNRVAN
jgi:conjugal transfer mating pair stabilization protein TraG